jgi:hypothetical protein
MVFLSGYDPALFDLVIHAAQTWYDGSIPDRVAAVG